MTDLYDRIGGAYSRFRRPDPRVTRALLDALDPGPRRLIADVGAGTGKYAHALADAGFTVKAIEPSRVMLDQAVAHERVEFLQGSAERLPLADGSIEAAVCVIAMSHFADPDAALREMDRVSAGGRIVCLVIDPREAEPSWFADYFPEVCERNLARAEPVTTLAERFRQVLGRPASVLAVPVPEDFEDLFAGAAWSRPELYLDEAFRAVSSSFALVPRAVTAAGAQRLKHDLATGIFAARYHELRHRRALDIGLRLLNAAPLPRR